VVLVFVVLFHAIAHSVACHDNTHTAWYAAILLFISNIVALVMSFSFCICLSFKKSCIATCWFFVSSNNASLSCSAVLCASRSDISASLSSNIFSAVDNHSLLIASWRSNSLVLACINANSSSNACLCHESISSALNASCTSKKRDKRSSVAPLPTSAIFSSSFWIASHDFSISFEILSMFLVTPSSILS